MSGDCGCIPGEYECGDHDRQRAARAYQRLSYAERAYDRYVDPLGAYHTDFPAGCSCHLSAPCSFCVSDQEATP